MTVYTEELKGNQQKTEAESSAFTDPTGREEWKRLRENKDECWAGNASNATRVSRKETEGRESAGLKGWRRERGIRRRSGDNSRGTGCCCSGGTKR